MPKKSWFADEISERYEQIEHSGGKVLQRWRGSAGNVRLSSTDEFLVISYYFGFRFCV